MKLVFPQRGNLSIPGISTHSPSWRPYVGALFPWPKLFSPSEEGQGSSAEALGREQHREGMGPDTSTDTQHWAVRATTYCFGGSWWMASSLGTPALCFGPCGPAPSPGPGLGHGPSPGPSPGHLRKPDTQGVDTVLYTRAHPPRATRLPAERNSILAALPLTGWTLNRASRLPGVTWTLPFTPDLVPCSCGFAQAASSRAGSELEARSPSAAPPTAWLAPADLNVLVSLLLQRNKTRVLP